MDSIMLDTSFCMRLLKKDDEFHQHAFDYFEYFLQNKIELFYQPLSLLNTVWLMTLNTCL